MRLIFVRHGQTDYNKRGLMQGQEIDPPLNDTGRAQMEAAAQALPAQVDRIVASPMRRTTESVEILNKKYSLPIEFKDELKELRYGTMADKTAAQIASVTGEEKPGERDGNATFDYRPYGGESGEELKSRIRKCVEDLRALHENDTILAVSHGGVIAAMHALYHQGHGEGENGQIHEFIV